MTMQADPATCGHVYFRPVDDVGRCCTQCGILVSDLKAGVENPRRASDFQKEVAEANAAVADDQAHTRSLDKKGKQNKGRRRVSRG
jgi:predicted  nucleic acid-binding Zn-ribbon protein